MARFALCLVCLAALLCQRASGDIIRLHDPNFPAGDDGSNITKDTATGLEWLDLTLSTKTSFEEIMQEFGPGGRFAGFRHATTGELTTFFANAGVSMIAQRRPEFLSAVELLLNAMGSTIPADALTPDLIGKTQGMYDDGDGTNPGRAVLLAFSGDTAGNPDQAGKIHIRSNFVEESFEPPGGPRELSLNRLGHWLVRPNTIPEPSSIGLVALFASSLWGWWWWRGRQTPS